MTTESLISARDLAESFRFFSHSCQGSSPLYERLARAVSEDAELLDLASKTRHRPIPNIFFAAVQEQVLRGHERLGRFFPSVTEQPDAGDPWPEFKAFCLEHQEALLSRLSSGLCQTGEVLRCAHLFPGFHMVARLAGRPVHFIEVGCSAGLNLLWSHYAYDYDHGCLYGEGASSLVLPCQDRGQEKLPRLSKPVSVASCVGIDINPLEVNDEDQVRWMRALIWPEHRLRAERLMGAVAIAKRVRPIMHPGHGLDLLPGMLEALPSGEAVCIYHSYTLNQFTAAERDAFSALLASASSRLDVFELGLEWLTEEGPILELRDFRRQRSWKLARCEQHGNWIEWLGDPA